jgi:hypothetical protein
VPGGMKIPSGPYSLASCHTVYKLVRSFGTITEPLLDSSLAASPRSRCSTYGLIDSSAAVAA